MSLASGTRLGSYEITAQIGVGGMGEVYRATDTNLKRQVAIKVLPASVAGDTERLARFQREAEVLAVLNHPHIAAIYGLEKTPEFTALVMELVEGDDLSQRIARGAIPLDEALPIARQIAEALEAAHEQGIIHRDLKPANIKVRADGMVKVLDFGLAKAMEPTGAVASSIGASMSPTITTPAMTQMGMILGTAAYMSPEQARGRPVDRRADVWAFGCVLYEMLTGCRAFEGEDVADTLGNVMKVEPDWSRLPTSLSPSVTTYLRRSLEKNPKGRVGDIQDMRLALEGAFEITGARAGVVAADRPPVWRRALPILLTAIIVGPVAVETTWHLRPDTPQPVIRAAHPLTEGRILRNTGRHAVAVAPDGRHFIYNTIGGVYLRALDSLEDHVIPGTEKALTDPVFSPDGGAIAYFDSGDQQLKRISTTGGTSTVLAAAANPFGISWEDDGTILYGQDDGIWRVSENGGEPKRVVATKSGEQAHGPQRLPGGDWILFTLAHGEGPDRWDEAEVVAQSMSSGERRILRERASDGRYVSTGHLLYAYQNVLFAVPFDVNQMKVVGSQVPVVDGVRRVNNPETQTGAAHYGVSPNGTLVYIPGVSATDLYRLAAADEAGTVTQIPALPRDFAAPRISPDGRRIAVEVVENPAEELSHIYVVAKDTGVATQLTFDGVRNLSPVWTPDGRAIVYASDRGEKNSWGIYRKAADGSGTTELIMTTSHPLAVDDLSRDGVLVFEQVSDDGTQKDLWTVTVDGSRTPTRFVATKAMEFDARFSPDGRFIAYTSHPLGARREVFVRPYPVEGDTQWRISDDGGQYPVWAGDQASLYFMRLNGRGEQVRAALQTSPTLRRGTVSTLFSWLPIPERVGYSGDLADGRFVFVELPENVEAGLERVQVVTVFNWFEELKRRVPPN